MDRYCRSSIGISIFSAIHMKTNTLFVILLAIISICNCQPIFPQAPGMESYTYRNEFENNVQVPGTLDKIKSLGIIDVEFSSSFNTDVRKLRQLLDDRGMECTSFGVSFADLMNKTGEVVENATILGANFVFLAWLTDYQPFTIELAKKTVADFNFIGKVLLDHNLIFCYHTHGYEFVPYGDGTLFDVLVTETNPQYVSFEMDIFWVFISGTDPAALLDKYGNRFKLMHLKDLKLGVPRGNLSGHSDEDNDVALGTGQLDIRSILISAKKAGIRHYYIEDESSHTATQVPESIAYLKNLT